MVFFKNAFKTKPPFRTTRDTNGDSFDANIRQDFSRKLNIKKKTVCKRDAAAAATATAVAATVCKRDATAKKTVVTKGCIAMFFLFYLRNTKVFCWRYLLWRRETARAIAFIRNIQYAIAFKFIIYCKPSV